MKKFLMIGQIIKPQGVRGEIKVLPLTDDPERYLDLEYVFMDEKGETQLEVTGARIREGFAYITLDGITDRDQVERMRNLFLYIDRSNAAPLPEGRYYVADLLGMKVVDEKGNDLGKLVDVMQAGGNDVYEVKGKRVFRFPALKKVLANVDIEEEIMTLDSEILQQIAVYDDEN